MKNLRSAYQNDDNPNIRKFKSILDKRENHIMDVKNYLYFIVN